LKPSTRFIRLSAYTLAIGIPGTIIVGLISNILNDIFTKTQLASPQEIKNAIGQHLPVAIVGVIIWVLTASAAIYLRLREQPSPGQRLSTVTTLVGGDTVDIGDRDRRNQLIVLNQVRHFWIEGMLEHSLHGAAMIDIGLSYKPDAVVYPWQMVIPQSDGSTQVLPPGSKIIDLFDQHSGTLLILGEPGAGKTTILLDLARSLIARAEQDARLPIPVIFNLSSWTQAQQSLSDWLRDELSRKYNVPAQVGAAWIETDRVLPLLDGLDEVSQRLHERCIEMINTFRQDHGLGPLVVCSRSADYNSLKMKLRLETAVVLQPLTPSQIDMALTRAGRKLAAVRTTVKKRGTDRDALRTLLESPLMLSVVLLAYQDVPISSLGSLKTVDAWRDHVFTAYVQRMLSRPRVNAHYTSTEINRWLIWLAAKMQGHSQAIFYLEDLSPTWLTTDKQRQAWRSTVVISITLLGGLVLGLGVDLGVGLGFGLGGGLLLELVRGLIGGLGFGLGGGLLLELVRGLIGGLGFGLLLGLGFGLGEGLDGKDRDTMKPVEGFAWSWVAVLKGLRSRVALGLVLGLGGGLGVGQFGGLVLGLIGGLVGVVYDGLQRKSDNVESRLTPNHGVWKSARNALIGGLGGGLFGGLIGGLIGGLGGGLIGGLGGGLFGGLGGGLFGGLFGGLHYGGYICIRHTVLRLFLWRKGYIPLNYVCFLDEAADRILLRKVGGGYTFIHRMLLDYFASRYNA